MDIEGVAKSLASLVGERHGRITKVEGKPDATLPEGFTKCGAFSIIEPGHVKLSGEQGLVITTPVESFYSDQQGKLLIKTQNSIWMIELNA